jgi:hypothetical protein
MTTIETGTQLADLKRASTRRSTTTRSLRTPQGRGWQELDARQFARMTSGTPDLLVRYRAGLDNRYASCNDNCEPIIIEYEPRMIVLDVVNTHEPHPLAPLGAGSTGSSTMRIR